MNKEVTFGNILALLAVIVIPLIIWGVSVEKRFEQVTTNNNNIVTITLDSKEDREKMQENHDEVIEELHLIKLELKDKADRK